MDTNIDTNFKAKIDTRAFDDFNKALSNLSTAFLKMAQGITDAFYNMPPEAYHQMGMRHPKEVLRDYYLNTAGSDEVVDYIIEQPNHTWNGVTIYPDEAWRYRGKADWMGWRLA